MTDLAVLYLARFADGFDEFERFAASYRKHPPGHRHDLIIIAKGFENGGQLSLLGKIFSNISHSIVEMQDDIGVDIHAYQAACRQISHHTVCFINTHARLQADQWLEKLYSNFRKPGVGIVGATGSYESLYSSIKLTYQICWLIDNDSAFNPKLTRQFKWLFAPRSPASVDALWSPLKRIKIMLDDRREKRKSADEVSQTYEATWSMATEPGAGFHDISNIPEFPNPHIRTNVFMLSRERFLDCPINGDNKFAALQFESGPSGINACIRKARLRSLAVGADGVGYDVEQWPFAKGFRSGNQSNLLAIDNQTEEFRHLSRNEKRMMATMTWAGYQSKHIGPNEAVLGVPFLSNHPLFLMSIPVAKSPHRKL
ncbi:hypothetical protein [Bradyrhizobium genosp. P]|uniref:hypothetical protein n=1 Tax=Bradyrhizobium genosp. P TaxID=83641 RepID=UPI003CE6988B